MDFGVFLTTAQPPEFSESDVFHNLETCALAAERLAFDSVWLLEHHFTRYGLCPSTITLASYLLGQTSTLRVGTAITVITLDHPIRLAEQVAMLDRLSGGRFELGIGRGSFVKDFEAFGVNMAESHRLLSSYFEVIQSIWTTGKVDIRASTGSVERFEVYPHPVTMPHPPVVVVATSPGTIQWAAEAGLPMLMHYWTEDEVKRSNIELYAEFAEAAGKDPSAAKHVLSCVAFIGASKEAAQAEIREHLMWWFEEGKRATHLMDKTERDLPNYAWALGQMEQHALRAPQSTWDSVQRMMDLNPVGTVEQVQDRLAELADITGIERFVCGFEGAARPERTVEVMEQFSSEVAYALQAGSRSSDAARQPAHAI